MSEFHPGFMCLSVLQKYLEGFLIVFFSSLLKLIIAFLVNYKHTFASVRLSCVSQLRVKETNPANKDKAFGSYFMLISQGTFI